VQLTGSGGITPEKRFHYLMCPKQIDETIAGAVSRTILCSRRHGQRPRLRVSCLKLDYPDARHAGVNPENRKLQNDMIQICAGKIGKLEVRQCPDKRSQTVRNRFPHALGLTPEIKSCVVGACRIPKSVKP